jgi:uncharacterized membrane protein YjgN (DUF898 family)
MSDNQSHDQEAGAFEFDGSWQEFAPIAFTNLLLTIVTLGIYRFWATARTRRYLWSRTRFIDDRLEWAGTGMELFKGALMALLCIFLPIALLNMTAQRLVLNGHKAMGGILFLVMLIAIYFLVGVARFRALRYRLSRSYWRGIRGGSDDSGVNYGLSYLWKNFVGSFALGLLIPWSMVTLWNERWEKMSFGPYRFAANGQVQGLMKRFLLCYLAPFLGMAGLLVMMIPVFVAGGLKSGHSNPNGMAFFFSFFGVLAFYIIFGFVVMAYYAKFYRQMIAQTSLHTLSFGFSAKAMDWIKLFLGDFGLAIITLGIGTIFIPYRHWKFQVSHMQAYGEIDVDDLTASTTADVTQGEGLLDAFDMGAL